jgi:septal ring factor EnvC (AmiA/AmiB activator)
MANIKNTYGKGGAGLSTPDHDAVDLQLVLRDIADDLATLKTSINAGRTDETNLPAKINALITDDVSLRTQLTAAIADVTNVRTKFVAVLAKLDTLTTKLNADAGVTDTNYATDFASGQTPAAIGAVNPSAATATTATAQSETAVGTLKTLKV